MLGLKRKIDPEGLGSQGSRKKARAGGSTGTGLQGSRLAPEGCGAKPAKKATEAKLFALLKQLPPSVRRTVLAEHFNQGQRLALEQWMLAQRSGTPSAGARASAILPEPKGSVVKGKPPRPANRDQPALGLHCHRRAGGKILYRASVYAGPFRLTSNFTTQSARAQRWLQVLQSIRHRVLEGGKAAESDNLLEARLRSALQETPVLVLGEEEGRALRLYFTAHVSAGLWIGGKLSTPSFQAFGQGLERGLLAWRRISSARNAISLRQNRYTVLQRHDPRELEAAWKELKMAHLEVWNATGRPVSSKIASLEAKHAPFWQRLERRWAKANSHPQGSRTLEPAKPQWALGPQRRILGLLAKWKTPANWQGNSSHGGS